jgi:hypothetical protein
VIGSAGTANTSGAPSGLMKPPIIAIVSVLGASCAMTAPVRTADSVGASDGTYRVSARVSPGNSDAKAEALREAAYFCAARGASPRLVSSDARECASGGACDEAQITFSCAVPH